MENVTEKDYHITFFDCDYLERIKISTILRLCSELAGEDYTKKGMSHEWLWRRNMVFLLSRVSVRINKYPRYEQDIVISTWEIGTKGVMFLRGFHIRDKKTSELLCDIETAWILIDPKERHIHKPTVFTAVHPLTVAPDMILSTKPTGKISAQNLIRCGTREVRTSDIDANGHMFNAVYADAALDVLSKEQFERNIRDFRINFVSEAVRGDTINLSFGENNKVITVLGECGGKRCFEAEMSCCDTSERG